MILRTRKKYARELNDQREHGIAVGQRNARQRALNARDHGYQDGHDSALKWAVGYARELTRTAIEHALTKVEQKAAVVTALEAEATTRWEKRRLRGQLEALEAVGADLTEQLEELDES